MDGNSPNFIYVFILARSKLGFLLVISLKFVTEIVSLIDSFTT